MKEIYINADDYNSDSIRTIQGNNNAEEYKIYLQYDNEKIDLTGKTVNLGFLRVGSTEGDIIENLNVTNPKEGEITLKITNKISKRNGTYSCQLAILGEGDFLEHTATFTLTVENNIFSDITKAIADSKDFTYLENILDKASKLNEKLKENTSTATNANSNLESNITEANNINSKLLENTSTATSLNKNLESNIDLAKEVKETIKDLDTKNTEATEKIEELTNLNNKAEELSNNINQALPINAELIKNTESAKVTNTNLAATNQEATTKNTELQASLEKAKEFIDGLDGSQNIPQIRLDVDALQNGLKSNQALSYEGGSIVANETLEGRTEGMRISGRTLVNLAKSHRRMCAKGASAYFQLIYPTLKVGTYTVIINASELTKEGITMYDMIKSTQYPYRLKSGLNIRKIEVREEGGTYAIIIGNDNIDGTQFILESLMILEGDWTKKLIPKYFEGLKSFGEAEREGDKYKISILSKNKNLFNLEESKKNSANTEFNVDGTIRFFQGSERFVIVNTKLKENTQYTLSFNKLNGECHFSIWYADGTTSTNAGLTSYTTLANKTVVAIKSSNKGGTESILSNLQLEEGTQKTLYVEPRQDKKDILIKEPLRENDIMYEDNGQVKVNRYARQYTFTGNESIRTFGLTDKTTELGFEFLDFKLGFKPVDNNFPNAISNRFKVYSTVYSGSSYEGIALNQNGNTYIRISKDKLSTPDVNGIKAWLKANQTTIVYQLSEPTVEIVENCVDIDLDTFGEKTYFNILNSLPGTLDFKVPSNIASIVQNTAREVNNIWDVINNLLVPSIVKANGNLAMIKLNNNLK